MPYYRIAQDANGLLYGQPDSGGSLLRSNDHGQTWTTVLELPGDGIADMAFDTISGAIYACYYYGTACIVSHDGGSTWTQGDALYAGSMQGQSSALLPDPGVTGAVYSRGGPSVILRSADYGSTWQIATPPLAFGLNVPWATAATTPSRLYAIGTATSTVNPYDPTQIMVTQDNGTTWTLVGWGLPVGCVGVAVDVIDPETLYADCPTSNGYRMFVTHTGGL